MARDYKKEYKTYHAKPKQIKRRAQRNTSRALMEKAGRVKKGDGKDVGHKNYNTASNGKNLKVQSKKVNRADNRGKGGRPKSKTKKRSK